MKEADNPLLSHLPRAHFANKEINFPCDPQCDHSTTHIQAPSDQESDRQIKILHEPQAPSNPKKNQRPENPPGSGKTHRPSRSPALGGVIFNPFLPFSDMHEKKTLLCHALPSPRFRVTKDRSRRAGTGKIEKRGVMSERVLADDFLKWECEGEGGDGYAYMNEMAGWGVVQRLVRGPWTRKHASAFLLSWTPSIHSLFIFNFASFHSSFFMRSAFRYPFFPENFLPKLQIVPSRSYLPCRGWYSLSRIHSPRKRSHRRVGFNLGVGLGYDSPSLFSRRSQLTRGFLVNCVSKTV